MINGNWVLKNGTVITVNEAEVFAKARAAAEGIRNRAGIKLPPRFPVAQLP